MAKIFYTQRDIEDLVSSGVATLVINDDVVITDLGREAAEKLGLELVRENDQPSSAPIRPYLTDKKSPAAASSKRSVPKPPPASLEDRVFEAVKTQVGNGVDPDLLRMIIQRVLKSVEGS